LLPCWPSRWLLAARKKKLQCRHLLPQLPLLPPLLTLPSLPMLALPVPLLAPQVLLLVQPAPPLVPLAMPPKQPVLPLLMPLKTQLARQLMQQKMLPKTPLVKPLTLQKTQPAKQWMQLEKHQTQPKSLNTLFFVSKKPGANRAFFISAQLFSRTALSSYVQRPRAQLHKLQHDYSNLHPLACGLLIQHTYSGNVTAYGRSDSGPGQGWRVVALGQMCREQPFQARQVRPRQNRRCHVVGQMTEGSGDAPLQRERIVAGFKHCGVMVAFHHDGIAAGEHLAHQSSAFAQIGQYGEFARAVREAVLHRFTRIVRYGVRRNLQIPQRKRRMAADYRDVAGGRIFFTGFECAVRQKHRY
jgi:hypothetical protein